MSSCPAGFSASRFQQSIPPSLLPSGLGVPAPPHLLTSSGYGSEQSHMVPKSLPTAL